MTSRLLIRPARDGQGVVHRITPQSAGWRYVGFELRDLVPGALAGGADAVNETCLVLVRGCGRIVAGGSDFGVLGERMSPFEGGPHAVYVPPRMQWQVIAETEIELAICTAPAHGGGPARGSLPAEAGEVTRGSGSNTRFIRNIVPDTASAETLLVVEAVTPGGNWSSYPPHKHDTDDFPRETYLEETYYHRLRRGSGFALQRVYTGDGALDESMAVHDRDVVLVPRGYHPVGATHGFDLYYLNVMAGPRRAWKFSMDPDQAHLPY